MCEISLTFRRNSSIEQMEVIIEMMMIEVMMEMMMEV